MSNAEEIRDLARRAQQALQEGDLVTARQRVEDFLEVDGTDRLWGLSFLDGVLGQMLTAARDEEERRDLAARQRAIRDEVLGADDGDLAWVHAWERARLLNARAWDVVEHGGSQDDQLRALADVERSLAFWPYFLSHQDTRLRLLLALGRAEEAFRTLRWFEALQPGLRDVADLVSSPAYRDWLAEHTCDTLQLPEGPATAQEQVQALDPELRSPPDARLGGAERAHLRGLRCGDTEWHRARNAALVALLLDSNMPVDELISLAPQQADLSEGVIRVDDWRMRMHEDTLLKLRHWLLWAANNHPAAADDHPPPGIRQHLFLRWSQDPLRVEDIGALLDRLGQRAGIEGLTPWRCQRLRFERFHGGVLGEAERRGTLHRVEPAAPAQVKSETVATAMRWVSRGEDTYVPYSYEVDGVGYGFVYCTPYDEVHRFYGNHPAEWYDELTAGTSFRIGYNADDPREHRVLDPRFEPLNGQAMFVGAAAGYVTSPDDVDFHT